jgi:hypothetical protein
VTSTDEHTPSPASADVADGPPLRTVVELAIGFAVMYGVHAWLGIYRLLWFMFFGLLGWLASTLDAKDRKGAR